MNTFIRLNIVIPDHLHEIFISSFDQLEFSGFEQDDGRIYAYIKQQDLNDTGREELEAWLMAQRDECYIESEELIEERNWNQEWESTIRPQRIGKFVITPTWANPQVNREDIVIEIDPKMAFGTGYHETTRLMLRLLPEVISKGDRVLDAGTGSGVLAIGALKLGAAHALGFDNDEWSYQNATENALLNHVSERLVIKDGDADTIDTRQSYDVVLANINRNILMEMAELLTSVTKTGGNLVLSGLMLKDEETILNHPPFNAFDQIKSIYENEWVAVWLKKPA